MQKIFLSCGQANDRERSAAARVKETLTSQEFDVYVAIQAQSIQDVNSGIIAELQRSDYYLFVDFRREVLGSDQEARGSLFTHQELAIAYVSGFEHVLFFQERGMKLEGLMRYLAANPTPFDTVDQLVEGISKAIRGRAWRTDYSRHLIAARPRWSDSVIRYANSRDVSFTSTLRTSAETSQPLILSRDWNSFNHSVRPSISVPTGATSKPPANQALFRSFAVQPWSF